MYPQCKAENAKRLHRNSYVNHKSIYYVVDASDYSSKSSSSLILNFEDNDNLMDMPNRCQQKIKVLNDPLYENEQQIDDDIDFLLQNDLSCLPQYHDRDHHHQCCQSYQFNRRLYDHSHWDYNLDFNDDASLQSNVRQRFVNKNSPGNNNNNNNNDTNSCATLRSHYDEDYKYQPLPTVEWLQLKPLDHVSSNSTRNKRHQFHSDFYQYNNQSAKLPERPGRGRKLPSVLRLPVPSQPIARPDLTSVETQQLTADVAGSILDMSNNSKSSYNYMLTEKSSNNNEVLSDLRNGNWHYDSNDMTTRTKTTERECLQQKNYEFKEFKRTQYFEEEGIETSPLFLQKYKNKRELRTNSAANCGPIRKSTQISVNENQSRWKIINATNINEPTKNKTSIKKSEIYLKNIKLPVTSSKVNVSSTKKCSPPAKNRRVLLYNIQSPTLSRLSSSNLRLQRLKYKQNLEYKDQSDNYDVLDSRTKNCDNTSNDHYELPKNIEVHSSSDNEYDEFENDIDNSSCSENSSDSEEDYRSNAYKISPPLNGSSTAVSFEPLTISKADIVENPDALLVPSLFPNVPPYLAFSSNTTKGPEVPSDLYRVLKWRVTNVMPRVVRSILTNSGMRLLKKTNEWMGVWGKHMKSPCFKVIRPYQKINHLPGSFKIGRKDSCWKNLAKLMEKHGKKDFGFMPKTYIIPNDLKKLRKSWPRYAQKNVKWIIKPPASARGTGIRVVDRWAQIPKRKSLIVQKYIERPLLINGSKFDLRLYVLVTSINPLRVYMYHNGLARFASVKYSDKSDTLNDRCMHLTNYSINKFSSNYSKNEDVYACHGHKWTIKSLWAYLSSRGVRIDLLWAALKTLVLRTILAGENSINNLIRANVESKYSCFELFGFDVLLDADLVPWLLEVNISPSLHSELPLDSHVKAPLVQCVLNTALYNIPPRIPLERQIEIAVEMSLPAGPICYDKRLYSNHLSRSERIKHNTFTRKSMEEREEYVNAILEHLTPDDVRCLVIAEDELARCSPLERIFPTVDTFKYLKYTEAPRYYNRLLDAWETRFASNRIEGIQLLREYCEDQYHLQVAQIPTKKDFLAKFLRWVLKS